MLALHPEHKSNSIYYVGIAYTMNIGVGKVPSVRC